MLLSELKKHLTEQRVVNLFDLSMQFNTDPEVIRAMLSHWMQKGHLKQVDKIPGCGGKCTKCDPLITDIYEWTN